MSSNIPTTEQIYPPKFQPQVNLIQQDLAKRWTVLPNFREIHQKFLEHQLKLREIILLYAGRRSYKTELAKRKLTKEFCGRENAGNNYFIGAPTRPLVKRIYWDDMKALIPKVIYDLGIVEVRESDLIIRIKWSPEPTDWTSLHLLGLEIPERFEGIMWHGGLIDEIADCKVSAWKQHIYPGLGDSGAWVILLGVPEGVNFYREYLPFCMTNYSQGTGKMVVEINDTGNPNWTSYTWFSSLVLAEDVIAEYKRTMDERTYQQEYEGHINDYGGQLYYTFSDANMNDDIAKHNTKYPICLTTDFNKAPMVWEVSQDFEIEFRNKRYKAIKFIDEISIGHGAKTRHALDIFIQRYKDHQNRILYLTGDASGDYEDHKDWTTDYTIIKDELKKAGWTVVFQIPKSNPGINNRVNLVCSMMRSSAGIIRLYFNEKCRYARADMEKNQTDDKGRKDKSDPLQTHGSDNVDYRVWQGCSREFFKSGVKQL